VFHSKRVQFLKAPNKGLLTAFFLATVIGTVTAPGISVANDNFNPYHVVGRLIASIEPLVHGEYGYGMQVTGIEVLDADNFSESDGDNISNAATNEQKKFHDTKGWGGGLQMSFSDRLTVRGEYAYFESRFRTVFDSPNSGTCHVYESDLHVETIRASLLWHFSISESNNTDVYMSAGYNFNQLKGLKWTQWWNLGQWEGTTDREKWDFSDSAQIDDSIEFGLGVAPLRRNGFFLSLEVKAQLSTQILFSDEAEAIYVLTDPERILFDEESKDEILGRYENPIFEEIEGTSFYRFTLVLNLGYSF
jgi:hypothetical protein